MLLFYNTSHCWILKFKYILIFFKDILYIFFNFQLVYIKSNEINFSKNILFEYD